MARSLTWRCCPWCLTEDEKTAARIDQEINKILLEQKRRDRGELKLLLLGESRAWWVGRRKKAPRGGPHPHGGQRTWESTCQMRRPRHREAQFLVQTRAQPPCRASAGMEMAGGMAGWGGSSLAGPAHPTGSVLWEGNHELRSVPAQASKACPVPPSPHGPPVPLSLPYLLDGLGWGWWGLTWVLEVY